MKILLSIGTSPRLLMLGFMIPTAFLSMWISNTATTVMMIPILQAVLLEIGGGDNLERMMMLGIAYSANVGGTGTLIGTPPNLILAEFLSMYDSPINFLSWMGFCAPQMIINVLLCWVYLQIVYMGIPGFSKASSIEEGSKANVIKMLQAKYEELGSFSFHEFVVSILFCIVVCLWFFLNPDFMVGWARALKDPPIISSATPAIFIIFFMFFIPANPKFWKNPNGPKEGEPIISWPIVEKK